MAESSRARGPVTPIPVADSFLFPNKAALSGFSPANVVVVGDIFSNHVYPIIDLASGGSIDGMIQSLDRVLAQTDEQTKIVPGHGSVATHADLQDYRDMLVQVRQRIKVLIAAGKTIAT